MGAGGIIYHYQGKLDLGLLKALKEAAIGQESIPVFKLISPDGTGGSCELCVHNPQRPKGKKAIGEEGQSVTLRSERAIFEDTGNKLNMIVEDPVFKGSYNYSETIQMGIDAHEHRDVKPHKTSKDFYIPPR